MKHLLPSVALLVLLSGCAQDAAVRERKSTASLAQTAEQRTLVRAQERRNVDPLVQIGGYLDSANAARLRLAKDPSSVPARSDYNFAVARVVEIVSKENLKPWERALVCPSASGSPWQLTLVPPDSRPQFHPSKMDYIPTDRLMFHEDLLSERTLGAGLGAPVVAKEKGPLLVPGAVAGTGRDTFRGLTASLRFSGRRCEIRFSDPLKVETLRMDGKTYPLAEDSQAPLAMTLASADMKQVKVAGLFNRQAFENSARLVQTEPYSPKKIPVVFVHGLGDSPATFVSVIQYLRSDPFIRSKYQFWVFTYPSDLPYPLSAAILRYRLNEMRRLYPGHKDIVLIGHSMGAMISRLLLTDSGTVIWNAFFDKPPGQIPFSAEARKIMSQSLIFRPQPKISRVVFLSGSHRGSDMASSFFGRLSARLVGNPVSDDEINKEVYAYVRSDVRAEGQHRLPNSIDLLAPDNHFLKTVSALPLKAGTPFHSLIGNRGRSGNLDNTKPVSSDGVVPYWSSHLAGARSERIVPSGHWSHLHPSGMREIKRILTEHVQ